MADLKYTKLNFQWKKIKSLNQTGETLLVNGIRVAVYSYSLTEKNMWNGHSFLPDIAPNYFEDTNSDILKITLEQVVKSWFQQALGEAEKGDNHE